MYFYLFVLLFLTGIGVIIYGKFRKNDTSTKMKDSYVKIGAAILVICIIVCIPSMVQGFIEGWNSVE